MTDRRNFRIDFDIIRLDEPDQVLRETRNLAARDMAQAQKIAEGHAQRMVGSDGYCLAAQVVGIRELTLARIAST